MFSKCKKNDKIRIEKLPLPITLEADKKYSFWYTYQSGDLIENGVSFLQYWGSGGANKVSVKLIVDGLPSENEKVTFMYDKVSRDGTKVDNGDNGSNWGQFPMLVFKV